MKQSKPKSGRSLNSRQQISDVLLPHKARQPPNAIRGAVHPKQEMHFVDISGASYVADTTGTVTLLNSIAQGSDNTNRLGRECVIRDVAIRGFEVPTSSSIQPQATRLVLVWDNAPNGAAPAITDVLTAANPWSFPNVNNIARFTILHDELFVLGTTQATGAAGAVADHTVNRVDLSVRVNSATQFLGTTTGIASIQNGALFMLTMGSAAPGSGGTFSLGTRCTFVDVL
jgi:hypothetical protein